MAAGRPKKGARKTKNLKSRPVREIPFEYDGIQYKAFINGDSQISFEAEGRTVDDPDEQNRLMDILLILNKQL